MTDVSNSDDDASFNTIELDESSIEDDFTVTPTVNACEVCVLSFLHVENALRSFWNYLFELDSYRPVLALVLWIANKISYQEDPTSYSTSYIDSEYGGRIYNHIFKNNRALYDEMGGRWLFYKWITVLFVLLATSLFFEYAVRRLLLKRIMGCWGFKRDKGSFFIFFFALITSLYLSVVVFDRSLAFALNEKTTVGDAVLYDGANYKYENETNVFRLTPWCTMDAERYKNLLFVYQQKLRDYDKGKSNYEYLPETYCFFGKSNDTFSKNVYSDEHFQNLYKKHASDARSEYDTKKNKTDDEDVTFIKNRCFRRLIASTSFEIYDDMFDTIFEDRRFDSGGYCEYVWRIVVFERFDVYDLLNVNMRHENVVYALKTEKFKSSTIVRDFNEGLLNRISGLFTDACDMLTFFIVLDEYLQKREQRKRRARLIDNNSGEGEKCPQCSWRYVRLWIFWVLLALELCYLMFYASMSFDYAVQDHRCSQLNRFDFDNKNITFNSFYFNTYDDRNVADFYKKNKFNGSHGDTAALFDDDGDLKTEKYFTTFHKVTMVTDPHEDGYENDDGIPSCSSIWNDRFLMGMTKQHRITLSVIILMLDLVLVLFSTDFPSFDAYEKILRMKSSAKNKKEKTIVGVSKDFDEVKDHFSFFDRATDRYLSNRSLFYTIYYVLFKKGMCFKCLKKSDRDYFLRLEDNYQHRYASEKQRVYFIPGFQSTQLDDISDCCKKNVPNRNVGLRNDGFGEKKYDDEEEYDDNVFDDSEEDEEFENSEKRREKCFLNCKKWFCKCFFGCFCFCCYESLKYSRNAFHTTFFTFKKTFPYVVRKPHPVYERKINSNRRKNKRDRNEIKNKPIITARWIMFMTLFAATFFNIASLIQQCSFQPSDFNQIETIDGSIHLLNPAQSRTDFNQNVNLCMVCPKKITIDNDPYNQRSIYDAFFKKSWRTIYETTEWTTLSSVRDFGDVTRSFVSNKNEKSRKLSKKMCKDVYGEGFWDDVGAHCSVWSVKQESENVFAIETEAFEKLDLFSSKNDDIEKKQCRLKKKIKFKCDVYGRYERELNLKTPFPYYRRTFKSNDTHGPLTVTVDRDDNKTTDALYDIKDLSYQKDCNVYSYSNAPTYWDDSRYDDVTNVYDSEYDKKGDWFYHHDRTQETEEDAESYCLSMSVLEWSEFNCESANDKEYLEDRYKGTDDDMEHVYDVFELKYLDESIVLDYNERCWVAAYSEIVPKPRYVSNVSHHHHRKDVTMWGFEYEGTEYNYGHKKIWIGDAVKRELYNNNNNNNETKKIGKTTIFLPSKTTVGCKITTCPTRTRNDQTDMASSDYLNIVLHTIWLPVCVVVYMIWSFALNVYVVKMLKNYKDIMFLDAEQNAEERRANKKKMKRLKCMVSCCLMCHCK